MLQKATVILVAVMMCLLGVVPVLAIEGYGRWATPAEYEKATGKKIEKYSEAPELRTLVAAGELPPVEKRLPEEPLVVRGPDGIGKYGGTLGIVREDPGLGIGERQATLFIQGHYPYGKPYPNVVKSFKRIDPLGKEWIIKLREGMRWSDGAPFTADDVVFAFNDVTLNKEITPAPPSELISGNKVATIEKIDDYTVKYHFPKPFRFTHIAAPQTTWYTPRYPKHYLKQFHPKYTDKDTLDKLVKKGGFNSWMDLFDYKMDLNYKYNTDLPTVEPWVLAQAPPDTPVIWRRNPYYWVVDEEGNQLPYIDERTYRYYDTEVVNLKCLAGELDRTQGRAITLYPLLKKAEKKGKIKAFLWALPEPNCGDIQFNLTCKDPVKRKIFRDKRFRFAASYSLDREKINELAWLGVSKPWQVAPSPSSPFYNDRLAHTAIEYDPAKANELLDEMGLDKRDANDFRLGPNGKKLQINFIACPWDAKWAEIAIDNLKAVGLNCNLRIVDFSTLNEKRTANALDAAFIWEAWGTVEGRFIDGDVSHFIPGTGPCFWAPAWAEWYTTDGKTGEKPIPEILEAIEAYKKAQATFDLEEQKKWFGKVLDIAADNLWTIGTVSVPGFPYVMVINSKLRNFPTTPEAWWYGDFGRPGLCFYEE